MSLQFRHLHHAYGGEPVLQDVSLTAGAGEITCLLGPSGCGKTTLLRVAAGIAPVQKGEIWLDGALLAAPGQNPAPERRPVGLVFQEGALFPHLTVQQNVAFGLNGATDERARRVSALLDQVGLAGFESRHPHTLSGGQQQRVALARALAPAPRALLLDEPFASLDMQLRRRLREETRRILKASGGVTILVTHDPDEALEMADRIAVLEEGRIVQAGEPDALYDQPATPGVASLIGEARPVYALIDATSVETPFGRWPSSCLANGAGIGEARLMVRPHAVEIAVGDGGGVVTDVRGRGQSRRITVEGPGGESVHVDQPRDAAVAVGDRVLVAPRRSSIFAFPRRG
ncbi:MAG: ABC transporter ATP-binding protein [Caulobacterales bacterium]|nr:ABC transporter ATP-binding protein [Caulobacterales bacterium]